MKESLEKKEQQLGLFELLRDHFEINRQINQLADELALPENKELLDCFPSDGLARGERLLEQYSQAVNQYEILCHQFDAAVGLDKLDPLVLNGKTLDTCEKQLSGWRQGTASLTRNIREHQKEYRDLAADLQILWSGWGTDPACLDQFIGLINRNICCLRLTPTKKQFKG